MIVRFATLCDTCRVRSGEYAAWPSCRECGEDCCLMCAAPGSFLEGDGAEDSGRRRADTVICPRCAAEDGPGVEART
jgi:hypothetical protein